MKLILSLSSLKDSLYTLIKNECKRGESLITLDELIWSCWEYYASVSSPELVNHLVIEQIIQCYLIDITKENVNSIKRIMLHEWDGVFNRNVGMIDDYKAVGDTLIVTLHPKEYSHASGY
jgi:hypothetical protein